MKKLEGWQENGKQCLFYYALDNSDIHNLKEKVDVANIFMPNNGETVNLGLHRYKDNVFTSNYVGICRLKDSARNNIKIDESGKEVILRVEPRFPLSIVKLLNYIKNDDEFDRYLAPQTTRYNESEKDIESLSKNEIFHFFEDEPPIKVEEGFAMESSIITISVFLTMLKNLCKKPLKGRMIKKEENLVGKVKGKIVFHQNIKNNTIRGRDDRFYCQYLKYSEDIIENQILKAALLKAKRFVTEYFGEDNGGKNSFVEMIVFCNKSFAHISKVKVSSNECDKLKFSGCYSYYKPVIKAGKMVLDEISIESSGKVQLSNYVIPYAISMEKLFEIYVRSYLKQNGFLSYKEQADSGIQLGKFDEKLKVFAENNGPLVGKYIAGNIKPDIILKNLDTGRLTVFDVKYKKYGNTQYVRNDRLQLLAYSMMYDTSDIGIIFPMEVEEKNRIFESQKINTYQSRDVKYHQIQLAINEEGCANDVAEYINNIVMKDEDNYSDKLNSLSITKNPEPYKDSVKTYLKASENGDSYLGKDVTFDSDLLDE
ncbi:McrC family protein [Clostridium estertheticum]|uniref:McrC family protein n=1 Tax=Clostridium estertheticum TaxID=238834 RepID=UPI001C6E64C3|nr:McrC family protein [Clostridium estertheticum]MBW9151458.1 McrC family protein [Clostridium estertheticum]WLC83404.1 McrC family protein [Clostridium estertheticum]